MPRLGIDARTIFSPSPRGTGRNLADVLPCLARACPDWEILLYHQRPAEHCAHASALLCACGSNVRARQIDLAGDRWDAWFQVRLPLAAWRDRVDLLHLPASAAPVWLPVPSVVTIHDLIPLVRPDELNAGPRRRFERGVRRAVRSARRIIAVSQTTARLLEEQLQVRRERIHVIAWAPDRQLAEAPADPERLQRLRADLRLHCKWLLNFSGDSRRKNAAGLLAGFARLPVELRGRMLLVLVGCEPAEYRRALAKQAATLGIAERCRFLPYVDIADAALLLRHACGLPMPSLAEGFGLPILDAFAARVPVLTSNLGSMVEVAGGAAELCDPHSADSIAAGLARLLDDDRAAERVRGGAARVTAFSWQQTAEQMAATYVAALGENARSKLAPMSAQVPA